MSATRVRWEDIDDLLDAGWSLDDEWDGDDRIDPLDFVEHERDEHLAAEDAEVHVVDYHLHREDVSEVGQWEQFSFCLGGCDA